MNWRFQTGECFKTEVHNHDVIIKSGLVKEPTGEIYSVSYNGLPAGVKLYSSQCSTAERRAAIKDLIESGPPDHNFLWPVEILSVTHAGGDCFGYVVPLPDAAMRTFELHHLQMTAAGFKATILSCVNLALSFANLHTHGYCFNSIALKNLFADPLSSKILIFENENIVIDEALTEAVDNPSEFSAPEIILGRSVPSVKTDLHLLAALLFYRLFKNHPLDGAATEAAKQLAPAARLEHYGRKASFIFHPKDNRNAPIPHQQDEVSLCWKIYPQFLKDLFSIIFIKGLTDSSGRLSAKAWCHQLMKLHDSLFNCQECGKPNFYCQVSQDSKGASGGSCWSCSAQLKLPPKMSLGKLVIMLNPDTQLYPYHTQSADFFSFARPTASVTHLPADPRHFGLRNDGTSAWSYEDGNGSVQSVPVGSICPLLVGSTIYFGTQKGLVVE